MSSSAILDRLGLTEDSPLANLVERNLAPCFVAKSKASTELSLDNPAPISKLGGLPDLATETPKDKTGKPLLFLGQINFAELCAEKIQVDRCAISIPRGLLSIFWNERKDMSNPKDRHSFRILWTDSSQLHHLQAADSNTASLMHSALTLSFESSSTLPQNPKDWIDSNSVEQTQIKNLIEKESAFREHFICQIFGNADAEIAKKKEIAAFASNGVSWSPARSADSCYSHLVDASRDWVFLLRLNSKTELGFDLASTKSITLLIHSDDLIAERLDKAWMVY